MTNKVIPIKKGCKYKKPKKPTALSWEEVLPALLDGKKCRRLQWDAECYIKQDNRGIVLFHFVYYNDTKKGTYPYDRSDMGFQEDIEAHDWIVIDKKK